MEDRIHGLTMRDCAEIIAQLTELKTQYGERNFKPHFEQYLASRGTNEAVYSQSWNAWWARINADPTGQLQAQHALLQSAFVQKAHTSDVADMSQESKGGLSLDHFAMVSARTDAGEDVQAVLAAVGLDPSVWHNGSAAWRTALAAGTDAPISKQYAHRYAKHNPTFQKLVQGEREARSAAERVEAAEGERKKALELEELIPELEHELPARRWDATYHVAHLWEGAQRRGDSTPELHQATARAAEVMNECLSGFASISISSGTRAANNLAMLSKEGFFSPAQASDAHGNITRCLNRARESLATLETAFASISDQRVPERIPMQQQIQDYTSMVESLTEILETWQANGPKSPSMVAPTHAMSGVEVASPAKPTNAMSGAEMAAMHRARRDARSSAGLAGFLKSLPLIGWIFRILF